VFKKFLDKIKVVFDVRSSIHRIQYWECKQIVGHVNVYKISKNGRTLLYILDLKHSSGRFRHLKDILKTIQNYDMLKTAKITIH
jgi:hypothetical protein